jgi:hypothetical protein
MTDQELNYYYHEDLPTPEYHHTVGKTDYRVDRAFYIALIVGSLIAVVLTILQ